jgi:hypothetical protein
MRRIIYTPAAATILATAPGAKVNTRQRQTRRPGQTKNKAGITQPTGKPWRGMLYKHGGLVVSATDDIVISGLIADIDKIIRYLQSVTMDFNGQAAGWYVPYIEVQTRQFGYVTYGLKKWNKL